jgi:hypothetical protein
MAGAGGGVSFLQEANKNAISKAVENNFTFKIYKII